MGDGAAIHDLITGEGNANDPEELLASGALVWVGNNLVFAVVYWLMDGDGPIARKHLTVPVDFAFTQHINPEMGPPGWRPVFLDYLHLGFTNATAFSPTDVMPLSPARSTRCSSRRRSPWRCSPWSSPGRSTPSSSRQVSGPASILTHPSGKP